MNYYVSKYGIYIIIILFLIIVYYYKKYKTTYKDYEDEYSKKNSLYVELSKLKETLLKTENERDKYIKLYNTHSESLKSFLENNVKSMPFLAGMIADYLTYDIEILAKKLDWGHSIDRTGR